MGKNNIDRSAMIVSKEDRNWGYKIVFDPDAIILKDAIGKKYQQFFPPGEKKFDEKIAAINYLNLRNKNSLKILDIGTGCGHLISMLSSLGHICQGTEITESLTDLKTLYDHYNLDVFNLEIKKQKAFELPQRYNLVTSLRTVFDYDGPWNIDDWKFFKENLFDYLEPAGEVFIKTNIKSIPSQIHKLDSVFGHALKGWNSLTFHIKKI